MMTPALKQNMPKPAIDSATGFLDRNSCFAKIAQLASLSTPDQPLTLIWISLDRFKQINQSFGHHGGDEVIVQIAQRLKNKTGPRVEWCRMSGDEFLCIALNYEDAEKLTDDLLHEIEAPLPLGDLLLHPSASLGMAQLSALEDPAECLERADRAMNTAKRAGGGRAITSGDEPLPGRMGVHLAHHELVVENKLHLALQQNALRLHYQPSVDADGRIISVEALMRCTGHDLSPAEFIPVAEKTGLIIKLGEWSLFEGAHFASRLARAGYSIPVSINVSRAQLATAHFSQALHSALLCSGVRPEQIELELTESLFMDNSMAIQENLRAAHRAGVNIAIDDFGTGYSCLANLKDIHAGKLKIDRAFVVALPEDKRALSVIRAIARLGDELGMQIVAEGVENQAQLDALKQAGIHTIQGYIHARPMPEESLLSWLANRKSL